MTDRIPTDDELAAWRTLADAATPGEGEVLLEAVPRLLDAVTNLRDALTAADGVGFVVTVDYAEPVVVSPTTPDRCPTCVSDNRSEHRSAREQDEFCLDAWHAERMES